MPSNYPAGPDNLPGGHVDDIGEIILALHVNRLDEALNAVMAELGNLPSGSYSSVKARLDATGTGLPTADETGGSVGADLSTPGNWIFRKSRKEFNVRDYDYLGADPALWWNGALTAAAGGNNGKVVAPEQTYTIQSQVVVPAGTHIDAYGATLKVVNGGTFQPMTSVVAASNVLIEGLILDCNKAGAPASRNGLGIGAPSGSTCEHIYLNHVEIKNCVLLSLILTNCKDGEITDCVIHDGLRDGIHVKYQCDGIRISDNHVYNVGDDCIAVWSDEPNGPQWTRAKNVTISDNVCTDSVGASNGIVLGGIKNATVTGNTTENTTVGAVRLVNMFDFFCEGIVIGNNRFLEAGFGPPDIHGYAILVNPGDANGGTQAALTAHDGAAVIGGVRDVTIDGNQIHQPRQYGIYLEPKDVSTATIGNVHISDNELVGSGDFTPTGSQTGIFCPASPPATITDVKIVDNTIRGFAAHGINLSSSQVIRPKVTDNTVQSNGKLTASPGIQLNGVNHPYVNNNRSFDPAATKTQTYGLTMASPTGEVIVKGNTFRPNLTAGINVSGLPALTKFSQNELMAPVSLASAGTILAYSEFHQVTGTTNITAISAGFPGQRTTLRFTSTVLVAHSGNLQLAGGVNKTFNVNDTLSLVCDGTGWYETSRTEI